ncbi:uncharacterized protein [Miscanthus floridulus]|uniref:uncharacterized protein n=1 Tax=Miscanthus floridulus TaxID=154761 RepID=UPI003458178A
MGGLASAVHWWEESQMRVLVLSSLVIQFLLLIFTYLRVRAIPGWFRFLMWLAYLGGDAIAIYALATLFNRHRYQECGSKSTLEVVWAPILLIHLGGHDGMTAYNIEDNELWSRHLLTAVSQVTVAIYIFCKSWPWSGGDKRLLQAAIVLFVPGVLKCFAKPLALKRASFKSLVSSPSAQSTTEEMKRLEEYVLQRQGRAGIMVSAQEQKEVGGDALHEFYSLCFDGYVASKRGKKSFSFYVGEKEKRPGMVAQYNLMGYFAHEKNNRNKVWIASKCGCKDFLDQHWCMKPCFSSDRLTELVLEYLKAGWKEEIIHDPVSYRKFNDNRGQRALEGYEDELGWSIKGPFDESVLLWHIATDICFLSSPYSEHIKVCASAEVPSTRDILIEFLRFFISPLIPARTKKYQCSQGLECKAVQCMQMSNYMMYLLFVNPEMLLPGTRSNLFTTAYNELKDILGDNNLNPQRSCCGCCQQVLDKGLMETLRERDRSNDRENFIDKAWDLAQVLLNMSDDKMWKVIQGVWVEMLCFSASRCRGYLHAKALGSGGEFLSYVWLLMFYMGMETFSERLQREELPSREANNSGAPRTSNATISSTSMASVSIGLDHHLNKSYCM